MKGFPRPCHLSAACRVGSIRNPRNKEYEMNMRTSIISLLAALLILPLTGSGSVHATVVVGDREAPANGGNRQYIVSAMLEAWCLRVPGDILVADCLPAGC
jgi:hypothetical protein